MTIFALGKAPRPIVRFVGAMLCLLATNLARGADAPAAEPERFDVVVYGGTSAGVIAAVQASEMGKAVSLIHPGKHLGGVSSGGLGATDISDKDAIGGSFSDEGGGGDKRPSSWRMLSGDAEDVTQLHKFGPI